MSELQPKIESRRRVLRFNSIWLVPLVALIVAGWMVYQQWASQGPVIELIAPNAEGLEVGKTKVEARNVDIGEVSAIRLSSDYSHAVIKIQMRSGTKQMLRTNTKFWVIKPRIGREGISGLGTLLSGAYIEVEPGNKGKFTNKFKILPQPPLSTSEDKGIRLNLSSHDISKMDVGTPVHFRGYEVGYIEKVGFDIKTGNIIYRIFIHAPYDSLVNSSVQFWITPGFSIKSSARGISLRMDSLETLLSGGISFGTTEKGITGHPVADLTHFPLYASKEQARDHSYTQFIDYVFLFNSNISGLEVGAPVEFRGIRIGTVTQVPLYNASIRHWNTPHQPSIPVLARIEPQRIDQNLHQKNRSLQDWKNLLHNMIKQGMRASLSTSNYLTGAKVINIDVVNHPKPIRLRRIQQYPIFPTVPSKLDQMKSKFQVILGHLADAPIQKTLTGLQHTLKTTDQTLENLKQTSHTITQLLKKPSSQQLPAKLVNALEQLNTTLQTYQQQGPIGHELHHSLQLLQRSLSELQPLLQQLRKQPNSLIFDKKTSADRQPGAYSNHGKNH
ncbi:MAG: Intermembrane transport protein PqiB [Candidatus Celerinatantimonas neptuna]|nr:MAG: Intermembrane transport protein PqiB [Candidatus Celerinatantimonas neptuna]